jgi:3-dehydroquinate synthase
MTDSIDPLLVDLGERSYPIHIGSGLLAQVGEKLKASLGEGRRVLVVTDDRVGPLYLEPLQTSLEKAGYQTVTHQVPQGEVSKSSTQLNDIWRVAVEARLDRNSIMVALGGGVVGDLAGFAAASFLRGISFVQVPTSLLAMVDSSVGGKTGINLPQGKNLVGAFHQPVMVVADLEVLKTLSSREFASGMAEVIKYGIIHDAELFAMLEANTEAVRNLEMKPLSEIVRRSCEIKADIVRQDEREGGVRAFLNFGHTLGHAIENVSGYGVHLHGEAIAAGMVYAARLSEHVLEFPPEATQRLVELLKAFGLPTSWPQETWPALLEAMTADKKAQNAVPRFVLCRDLGSACLPQEVQEERLQSVYDSGLESPA